MRGSSPPIADAVAALPLQEGAAPAYVGVDVASGPDITAAVVFGSDGRWTVAAPAVLRLAPSGAPDGHWAEMDAGQHSSEGVDYVRADCATAITPEAAESVDRRQRRQDSRR